MARPERPPLPGGSFVEGYLAFLLAKTSHLVSGGFHARLKGLGVSISTWRIVAVLQDRGRPVGELADMVLLNQPTLSKALDRLEKDGILERYREDSDRRSVSVRLLPRGRALAEQLVPLANAHEQAAFAHLDDDDRLALVAMLQETIARNRAD